MGHDERLFKSAATFFVPFHPIEADALDGQQGSKLLRFAKQAREPRPSPTGVGSPFEQPDTGEEAGVVTVRRGEWWRPEDSLLVGRQGPRDVPAEIPGVRSGQKDTRIGRAYRAELLENHPRFVEATEVSTDLDEVLVRPVTPGAAVNRVGEKVSRRPIGPLQAQGECLREQEDVILRALRPCLLQLFDELGQLPGALCGMGGELRQEARARAAFQTRSSVLQHFGEAPPAFHPDGRRRVRSVDRLCQRSPPRARPCPFTRKEARRRFTKPGESIASEPFAHTRDRPARLSVGAPHR